MPDHNPSAEVLAFGPFTLCPLRRELRRGGQLLELGTRALDMLILLASNPGRPVHRTELIESVWSGRTVERNNLTVQMSTLRRVLGGDPQGTPYVQTVPGVGYIFTPAVSRGRLPAPAVAMPVIEPVIEPGTVRDSSPPPEPAGPFVGRASELAEVAARLGASRLVCISGIGGVGKTRLALRAAGTLAPGYDGAVTFVDLAPLTQPEAVADAVANALGSHGAGDATRAVLAILRNRRTLLVLDNAEHVTGTVIQLVGLVLTECPRVDILVTSRGTLGLAGESILRLAPLGVPPDPLGIGAEAAGRFDSVRLFTLLAGAVVPGFRLDDATAPHVAEICCLLDGVALAIQMAVPRLQVLSPQHLAVRLREHFGLLDLSARGAPARQRTLRSMFDWSWALLQPLEQSLLCRLSTFSGGAPLDALVGMDDRDGGTEGEILDCLMGLVEQSLVVPNLAGPRPRYNVLEITRQYAWEQLTADAQAALRVQHARRIASIVERAEAEWPTMPGPDWIALYAAEAANIRSAVAWAFGPNGDDALGLRIVAHAYPLWWELPGLLLRQSRVWLPMAIDRLTSASPPSIVARLWFCQSWRDARMSDIWNLESALSSVSLFRELGEPMGLGAALWRAGTAAMTTETMDQSAALLSEAETVLRTLPPTKWLALCLGKRADLLARQGQPEAAIDLCLEALEIVERTGYRHGLMTVGSNMADMLYTTGQPDLALEQLGDVRGRLPANLSVPAVATLAAHLLLAGETAKAAQAAREAAELGATLGLPAALAWAAETAALVCARAGRLDAAAPLAGYARRVHPSIGFRYGARRDVQRELAAALAALPAPARTRLERQGAAWDDAAAWVAVSAATAPN